MKFHLSLFSKRPFRSFGRRCIRFPEWCRERVKNLPRGILAWRVILTLLFFGAIVYLALPRPRLYHLDVQTGTVQIEFTPSEQNRWLATGLEICDLAAEPEWFEEGLDNQSGAEDSGDYCDGESLGLAETQLSDPILELTAGTRANIEWNLGEGLNIVLTAGAAMSTSATLISGTSGERRELGSTVLLHRPPQDDGAYTAPLTFPFEGYGVFGTDARMGVTGMLRSGIVSVYEDSPWQERYLAGENPLSLGDSVRFTNSNGNGIHPRITKGFLRIEVNDEGVEQGINAVAYSGSPSATGLFDRSGAEVFRFGSEGYRFAPTLWTRLENAPDIIVLVALMGLVFAFSELNSITSGLFRPRQEPQKKEGDDG